MRKFRKNGARTAAFLMAVSVALSSSPTAFAASETETQVVEQTQEQPAETEQVNEEVSSEDTVAQTEETADDAEQVEEEVTTENTVVDETSAETEAVTEETEEVATGQSQENTASEEGQDSVAAADRYVLMNIPFDKFYENEVNNDVAVDTFTSATLNKTRTKSKVYNIENFDIEMSSAKYTYSGKAKTPWVKVKNGDAKLEKDVDYTVTYSHNVNAGMATITIQGIGKYTGTVTKEFLIRKLSIENDTLELSRTDYTYNKVAKKPAATVWNGDKIVAYTKTADTKLRSKESAVKTTYKLDTPAISRLVGQSAKQMTVKWTKNAQATGYHIEYSLKSDFSNSKFLRITGASVLTR